VSDTPKKPPVILSKGQTPVVPRPRTVTAATAAVGALIVLSLAEAVSMFGFTAQLSDLFAKNNAKASKPKNPYGPSQIAHDLHQYRVSTLVQALVVALAMSFLVVAIRRVRSASVARWALIVVMVLTSGLGGLIPINGLPALANVLRALMGLASLAAIVLLLLPESSRYFKACKAALNPAGAPPRPGLRDLFAPRPPAGAQQPSPAETPEETPASKPAAARSKAKTRVDEAAVAKGADLARNRAKASKSRRTEI
jgi:hypothetical protein